MFSWRGGGSLGAKAGGASSANIGVMKMSANDLS
jgi:hypothetical protein